VDAFRNYADYAETPEFGRALDELEALALDRPTAFMCAEAVWWQCHRRLIADYMLARGWNVVHVIAPELGLTQPGTSKHLRVLRDAGLVRVRPQAQRRVYEIDPAPLAELDAWLAPFRVGWGPRLDALATEVYRTRREHAAGRPSTTRPTTEERSA
jgi:DNA-binding transcriptional ArsR family regulator